MKIIATVSISSDFKWMRLTTEWMSITEEQKIKAIEKASEGWSIRRIRAHVGIDQKTFLSLKNNDEAFRRAFELARQDGLEELADGLMDIPDEEDNVLKARLKSDNTKWLLSKRKPLTYGDRLDVNVHQTLDITAALHDARSRLLSGSSPDIQIQREVSETTDQAQNRATHSESVVQPENEDPFS